MLRRTLLMLSLMAALCFGQSDTADRTGGLYNGHTWNNLSPLAKVMYLAGLEEGGILAAGVATNAGAAKAVTDQILRSSPEGFVKLDYVHEMDAFYKEPANMRIPIMFAYGYCNAKFKGTPEAALREMVVGYRQWAASAK